MSETVTSAKRRKANARTKSPSIAATKRRFKKADSFEKAVGLIRDAEIAHKSYAHYTSLHALIPLIKKKQLWLTRATSIEFDDLIESQKYGNMEALQNLFIACFSYSQSESAAMWRLYSTCDENAARLSLTKTALRDWIRAIKSKGAKAYPVIKGRAKKLKSIAIEDVFVHDVIYASVANEDERRQRAKSLCWNDQFTRSIRDLETKKRADEANGVLKDYEWRFEYESRLIVKIAENSEIESNRIAVDIPENVLGKMRFTKSPWLQDEQQDEPDSEWHTLMGLELLKRAPSEKVVTPSVLTGALKKWGRRRRKRKAASATP